LIALTPAALLFVGRTSTSSNLTALPFDAPRITDWFPSLFSTAINSSPSFKINALIPVDLMFLYLAISVFLTLPFFVPKIKYQGSSNVFTLITAAKRSPSANFSKFTIGSPLENLP
jgi:hypothetical protein